MLSPAPSRHAEGVPSLLLIDDHQAVLDALRMLLEKQPRFEVVDTVTSIPKALASIKKHEPEVAVMDLRIGEGSSLDAILDVKNVPWNLKLIMLSMYGDESYVWRALQLGADGYVLKKAPSSELIEAIHSVVRGERFVGSGISLTKLDEFERQSQAPSTDPLMRLTPREREIARLAAKGMSSKEIAETLGIGRRTVETHRANLGHKLGVTSPIDLFRVLMVSEGWKDEG
jgi:two-component system response regulator NreC